MARSKIGGLALPDAAESWEDSSLLHAYTSDGRPRADLLFLTHLSRAAVVTFRQGTPAVV